MRIFLILMTMLLALVASGCSNIEPWVKPYERANLADEAMLLERNPVSGAYTNHVHEARAVRLAAPVAAVVATRQVG